MTTQTTTCGDVWHTDCLVPVSGPSWSHDDHPDTAAKLFAINMGVGEMYPQIARNLAGDQDFRVRAAIASVGPDDQKMMAQLATDPRWEVRASVARNDACGPDTLRRLVRDPHLGVVDSALGNELCPPDAIRHAYNAHGQAIAMGVALATACPTDILVELLDMQDPIIDVLIAGGVSRMSRDEIEQVVDAGRPVLQTAMAVHPNTPGDLLRRIAMASTDSYVIDACLSNSNTPEDVKTIIRAAGV